MSALKTIANELQSYGRNGDTLLAHITPNQADLLKAHGGSGTINPDTGLSEYFSFKKFFKKVAPYIAPAVALFAPELLPAIGSALGATGTAATVVGGATVGAGTALATGGDPVKGALVGGATAGVGSEVGGAVSGATGSPTLASTAGGAASGATGAALTGGDVVKGALVGGATGAVSGGVKSGIETAASPAPTTDYLNKGVTYPTVGEITPASSVGMQPVDSGIGITTGTTPTTISPETLALANTSVSSQPTDYLNKGVTYPSTSGISPTATGETGLIPTAKGETGISTGTPTSEPAYTTSADYTTANYKLSPETSRAIDIGSGVLARELFATKPTYAGPGSYGDIGAGSVLGSALSVSPDTFLTGSPVLGSDEEGKRQNVWNLASLRNALGV